jgi:Flp pilus assembly protein TadD
MKRLAILYAENPGDNQKALDLALKAREAFPTDPALAKALGIIVYRQGSYTRAVNLLQESAGQRSDDAELMFFLGMAHDRLKHRGESRQALQRALDLNLRADLAAEARRTLTEAK